MMVGATSSLPAIPLPEPDVQTPNRVVDNSKGLFQSEPPAKPVAPPDATEIPKFQKNKPPKYQTRPQPVTPAPPPPQYDSRPSRLLTTPTTPPPNAIPYGQGGAPAIPRGSFTMGAAGATPAGMTMSGAGGGDFGSQYSWYVTAVEQRISSNWLQSTIDANLTWAPRVVVAFDILRDGTITNIEITQSSNNPSVDDSARRAVMQSSPLQRLPGGYAGSRVGVEFYFDYRKH